MRTLCSSGRLRKGASDGFGLDSFSTLCYNRKNKERERNEMFVIMGLGNPDRKYQNTRHNIGFDVMDALAAKYNISIKEKKHRALCGSGFIEGRKVLLVKPQTYMNLSGESLADILSFYKIDPAEELLVVFDDISLPPGQLRIRKKGSAGGHNGIKSLIAHAKTDAFSRIKVGVGEKPKDWDLADYVLGHFSKEERAEVDIAMQNAIGAIAWIVQGEIDKAMNEYNRKQR